MCGGEGQRWIRDSSAWTEQAEAAIPSYLENGFQIGDVTLAYMSREPSAGAMVPRPPVGADPALAKRWQTYLQTESKLSPSDFGASTWAQRQPSSGPAPACDRGDAASPSCASGSPCLLSTSDAADDLLGVNLRGRRLLAQTNHRTN